MGMGRARLTGEKLQHEPAEDLALPGCDRPSRAPSASLTKSRVESMRGNPPKGDKSPDTQWLKPGLVGRVRSE